MSTVISAENVSKTYRLGDIGGGTLREDLSRWWAKLRGKPDPLAVIGEEHHQRQMGDLFMALDNVSFDVRQGEVLGIIGRNGAGKSTLLKILSRVTSPTHGRIKVKGRIASLLEVGTGFHPELTGRENIFLNGAILGMTKAEIRAKFDAIVAFSEIEQFIDTPVKRYSSGMYVRLAFAVAAHLEPEILIVDEVLSVGDAAFQKKCLGKMEDVSHDGRTILFVSHNMAATRKLCTSAIWIDGGKIVDRGKTGIVVDHYLQQNMESRLESTWDESSAPGDHRVRLRSARVILPKDSDGLITVHTPLQIEFTYWNYTADAVLNLSMVVLNSDEVTAFATVSDIAPRPAGLIRQTVEIPGDFLNAGSYYVKIIIVEDASTGILFQNNVIAFDVAEGEIIGNWYGQTPGVVRPKLQWKSDVVETSDSSTFSTKS